MAQHLLQSLHEHYPEPKFEKVKSNDTIGEAFQKLRRALESSVDS